MLHRGLSGSLHCDGRVSGACKVAEDVHGGVAVYDLGICVFAVPCAQGRKEGHGVWAEGKQPYRTGAQ